MAIYPREVRISLTATPTGVMISAIGGSLMTIDSGFFSTGLTGIDVCANGAPSCDGEPGLDVIEGRDTRDTLTRAWSGQNH